MSDELKKIDNKPEHKPNEVARYKAIDHLKITDKTINKEIVNKRG